MENLLIYAWLAFSLAGLILWITNYKSYVSFTVFLAVVLLLLCVQSGFKQDAGGNQLIFLLIGIVSINWILSQLLKQKWRFLIGMVSTLVFIFWKNSQFSFLDYPLIFDTKNALFLPLIGAAFPLLLRFKARFLGNFFGIKQELMLRNLQVLGIGILILAALFFGGTFGLILVAVGYYASEVYQRQDLPAGSLALLIISFSFVLVKADDHSVEAFLHGSTLLGLFIGLGICLWIKSSERLELSPYFKKIAYALIPILLVFIFVYLEKFKEHTGGISALSGILIGLALGSQFVQEQVYRFYLTLMGTTICIALHLAPQFNSNIEGEQKVLNDKFSQIEENPLTVAIPKNDSLNVVTKKDSIPAEKPLEGKWKIISELSSLDFELGPVETRTKGFFKTINGEFDFNSNTSVSKLKVEIPLTGFSTNNDFRDEGMMSAEYFDVEQFPSLTFQSRKWSQLNNRITIAGDFTMRGLKQNLVLNLKIVARGKDKKGEFVLLTGKSNLDRTKHGMSSDPKIGDLVDFNFKLELRKL